MQKEKIFMITCKCGLLNSTLTLISRSRRKLSTGKSLSRTRHQQNEMHGLGLILEKQEQWQDAFDTWRSFQRA